MQLLESIFTEIFIRGGNWIFKLIYRDAQKFLDSLDVYNHYKDAHNEIWTQTSTWPIFSKDYENKLLNSKAKTIVLMGPVVDFFALPGVIWRFEMKLKIEEQNRELQKQILLYHIPSIPPFAKFILVDNKLFLSEQTEKRTLFYTMKTVESSDLLKIKSILLKDIYKNGEDALLTIYLMIATKARDNMEYNELIRELKTAYCVSVEKNEKRLKKEHKNLINGDLESLLEKNVSKIINYINTYYGLRTLEIKNDVIKKINDITPFIFSNKFRETAHFIAEKRLKPIENLPRIRIVVTDWCNLNCIYCPNGNEGYSAQNRSLASLNPLALEGILKKAYEVGFREFAITGGEPRCHNNFGEIIKLIKDFLQNHRDTSVFINTNAYDEGSQIFPFQTLLDQLSDYNGKVTFKVGIDGLNEPLLNDEGFRDFIKKLNVTFDPNATLKGLNDDLLKQYPKVSYSDKIATNVVRALERGFKVGLNFVLTKSNEDLLIPTLLYTYHLYNLYCKTGLVYFKILDLNWYYDIGNRGQYKLGSDYFWKKQYISPIKYFYEKELHRIFDTSPNILNLNTGIPILEILKDGFKLRIKDSALGTHYNKKYCFLCPFFVSNRCQEGIYQPWITSEGKLKICYHRPDIFKFILPGDNNILSNLELLDRSIKILDDLEYIKIDEE